MAVLADIRSAVQNEGFAVLEGILADKEIEKLLEAFGQVWDEKSKLKRHGSTFAVRNLIEAVPAIAELAISSKIRALVDSVLGDDHHVVRGILFDKVADANWKVPWHQDLTIAVREKVDAPGFGPWSVKAGVLHVQPPASILENMVSVRLHLDICSEANGALRVIPGSHKHGRILETKIPAFREETPEQVCSVGRGGALLMRPLLLHASSPSRSPEHRRVIHLDFASVCLPFGLQWHIG
jgi:ectoine hydroxylase-related dioxygenase (phytanoyl-CoA dioxygenase family)